MTDPGWEQVERLFHQTRDLHPDERVSVLEEVSDEAVRSQLESLLAAHDTLASLDTPAGFLQTLDPLRAGALIEEASRSSFDDPVNTEEATSLDGHPRTLGKYEILRPLGRGGMGMVYLGRDPDLDRRVAIKLLPPDVQADPEADRRLVAEARAGSALDHPNVGTVYEIGEGRLGGAEASDGHWPETTRFIAMAYYEGETLRARLEARPIPVEEAVELARQVASGLAAAHSAGVVHRDIKPENLILSRGTVKIVDFGIARYASATRTVARGRGTAAYMSPEQTRGEKATPATDVWALGVILFEMLAGQRPFPGDEPDAVIYSVRNDEPAPLRTLVAPSRAKEISDGLLQILDQCLTKDPSGRFSSGIEVEAALERLIDLTTAEPDAVAAAGEHQADRRSPIPLAAAGLGIGPRTWISALLLLAAIGAYGAHRLGVFSGAPLGDAELAASSFGPATVGDPRAAVVLADFGANESDPSLGRLVTEALRIDLLQSPALRVVESHEILETFQRMGHDPVNGLTEAVAREIAQRDGFEAVISGEAAGLGAGFLLAARVMDAATGRTVAAFRESAADSTGLLDALDRLSKQVREHLGESARELNAASPLPQVSTSSLPALERFAQATELSLSGGSSADVVALLEEAVALDSAFTSAYRALSVALWNIRADRARTVAATRAAYDQRSRLGPRERHLAEAVYHWQVRGDAEETAAAYRRLLAVDPGDRTAVNNLALALLFLGRPAEAERVIREQGGHLLLPGGPYLLRANLARALYLGGDTDGALAVLDSLVSESAGPAAEVERSRLLAAAGRWDDAEEAARTLVASRGENPAVRAASTRILWHITATRGRLSEADSLFSQLEALLTGAGALDELARDLVRKAEITRTLSGDSGGAKSQLRELAERSDIDVMTTGANLAPRVAAAFAAVGDTAEALALVDRWEAQPLEARSDPDSFSPELARARVEMARASSDVAWADSAAARLQKAVDATIHGLDYLPDLARAHQIAGRREEAVRSLREYVDFRHTRRVHRVAPYLGPALRELEALCTRLGDEVCATENRTRLAELWVDADSPLVLRP